jgi:hypothetical protein
LESFLPLITGGAGALVVLALWVYAFYAGKIHSHAEFSRLEAENDQLRVEGNQYRFALETERKTLNEAASAGQVTNQLITALTTLASGKPKPPELAAENAGAP